MNTQKHDHIIGAANKPIIKYRFKNRIKSKSLDQFRLLKKYMKSEGFKMSFLKYYWKSVIVDNYHTLIVNSPNKHNPPLLIMMANRKGKKLIIEGWLQPNNIHVEIEQQFGIYLEKEYSKKVTEISITISETSGFMKTVDFFKRLQFEVDEDTIITRNLKLRYEKNITLKRYIYEK